MGRLAAFLLTTLLLAGIVGCGNGDDNGVSAATTKASTASQAAGGGESERDSEGEGTLETVSLSKAEYVERAEQICSEGSEDLLPGILAHIDRSSKSGKSEGELTAAAVQAVLVPAYQLQIDKLHQLGAPAGDEKELEAFISAYLRAVESLERRQSMSLEPDLERTFGPAGDLALEYGILSCGN